MSNKRVVIWIDHKKAMVVTLIGIETVKHTEIKSKVGEHHHVSGGAQFHIGRKEKNIENVYTSELDAFYEQIIPFLEHSEKIIIVGPGEARFQLEKIIKKHKSLESIPIKLEPADKLTENQLVAFAKKRLPLISAP